MHVLIHSILRLFSNKNELLFDIFLNGFYMKSVGIYISSYLKCIERRFNRNRIAFLIKTEEKNTTNVGF